MEEANKEQVNGLISINQIEAIQRSRDLMIKKRSEINKFVEKPLVPACEHLWDLNIRTLSSSANKNDVGRNAYINIDFNSLSDENKQIAKDKGYVQKNELNGQLGMQISFPITKDTASEDIQSAFESISGQFIKQKATWIPSYSLQEAREIYGYNPEDNTIGPDIFIQEGLFYDIEGRKFYLSKEHFRKTKDMVE